MIAKINEIQRSITELLKPSSFKREAGTWRRRLPEVIQVLNLQKSRWGNQYYVNSGVLIRASHEIARPKPHQCHLLGRPEMILGGGQPEKLIINLEKSGAGNNVKRTLLAIERIRDGFFQECVTVRGIRRFLRKNTGVFVTGEAKEFLRLSCE